MEVDEFVCCAVDWSSKHFIVCMNVKNNVMHMKTLVIGMLLVGGLYTRQCIVMSYLSMNPRIIYVLMTLQKLFMQPKLFFFEKII